MTAEHVKSHAAVRPDALAIIDNGRQITYGEFARDIRKCIGALGEFGLTPGASVAINCGDFYVEWLLRLACEELSLTTARFQTPEISRALSSLQRFDLVLSSHPIDSRDVRRYHAATSEWIQGILNRPDPGETALPLKAADDVVSIIYTSGTTGTPKRLMLTRGVFERRVEKLLWFVRLTPASRYPL